MKKLLLSTAASILLLTPALADNATTMTTEPATVVTHKAKMYPMHKTETTTVTTKEVTHHHAH